MELSGRRANKRLAVDANCTFADGGEGTRRSGKAEVSALLRVAAHACMADEGEGVRGRFDIRVRDHHERHRDIHHG